MLLGALIDSLDDPAVAATLLAKLAAPDLIRRLGHTAEREGIPPTECLASTLRYFLETASEDHWVQLIGIMSRAADPGLAAIKAILEKALPPVDAGDPAMARAATADA